MLDLPAYFINEIRKMMFWRKENNKPKLYVSFVKKNLTAINELASKIHEMFQELETNQIKYSTIFIR